MTRRPPMTSPAEWKNEQSLESRALYALWRNHPLTAVKDRWGERAHRLARANRDMLLSWAATQPDYRLRDCRNIGVATLAWIRDHQPPASGMSETRKVLFSEELALSLGASHVDWGEPDADGFYTPTLYAHVRALDLDSPDPAPLDVERLARALHRSYDRDPAMRRIEWSDLNEAERGMWRRHAAAIVSEYARLEAKP
jgi:hypothetical protein